ncbi:FliH/SctL family protein [Clostridium polynesiense]|uniref:FliH/SctL family protein n=1 Tax=Clostridium polynesiense TaxID=1325933 RepID=UPI00058BA266|nr:FliH/SctL family protein [Clostridium polynesiense]
MQSSYNMNVIKAGSAVDQGKIVITTDEIVVEVKNEAKENTVKYSDLENYERLAQVIIQKAKEDSEKMLSQTYEEVSRIEEEAYHKGYEQGKANGYEDGYKDSYEANIEKAETEAAVIIKKADILMLSAKEAYEEYMTLKKKEIVELSIKIAESIIREKLEVPEGLDRLIFEAIETSKKSKSYIIKCNPNHISSLREKVDTWKQMLALNADFFVIGDLNMDEGNAVIEKENGRIKVGIDISLEQIKEIFN